MEYQSKIIINAPCEQVFNAISNPLNFPHFDPNCIKIEGIIKNGQVLRIHSRLHSNGPVKVRISALVKNHKIVWESGLPLGLYKRERTFSVFAKDDHTAEFKIQEVFGGPLFWLFENRIPDMSKQFQLIAQGLKKFLESR